MKLVDSFFREDETLAPRLPVLASLAAFAIAFLLPFVGILTKLLLMFVVLVLLVPGAYAVLRLLLPLMDANNPEADPIAVWAGAVLAVVIGLAAFGWMTIPALAVGTVLLARRAPELFEPFDMPDGNSEDPDTLP
ncbi:MAG: hypothetical protein AAGA32_00900 [Pseudomonadota bacterium]